MVEHDAGVGRRHLLHLAARDPDAVHDVEPRPEQARALEIADERALVLGELIARDQHLAARLVDVRIDREVVLLGKLRAAFQHFRRAALRRERRNRPVQRAGCGMPLELMLEIIELLADRQRLVAHHLLHVGRQHVLVAHHADRRDVGHHGRKDDADAGLAISRDDDVGVFIVEGIEPQHVLQRGDAAVERLDRADERARAHLLLAAVRPHRHRVEEPHLERQLFEHAAAERVVRMVVRVDEPGDDEAPGRVDHVRAVRREIAADRDDVAALDQDVGVRRPVHVAVVVIDLAAADQQSVRDHGCLAGLRRGRRVRALCAR